MQLSRLTLGTWQFSGTDSSPDMTWSKCDERVAHDTIQTAVQLGITSFDTAEAYGNNQAEMVLGEALATVPRENVQILSKFGKHAGAQSIAYSANDIEVALEKSLGALKTNYIDIYQVHWATNVANMKDAVTVLERAVSLGKIKRYGVSNFGVKSIEDMVVNCGGAPVTNQLPYNLLWRAIEYQVLPATVEHNMGVLAYSSLQEGLLSGKYRKVQDIPEGRRRTRHFAHNSTSLSRHGEAGHEELTFSTIDVLDRICAAEQISLPSAAIAWLLAQKGVQSVIFGATSPDQVRRNAAIPALRDDVLQQLTRETDALKAAIGSNPDQFSQISRYS